MSERFELLDVAGDISGKLRLIYGSGPADPAPFVLTLAPQSSAGAIRVSLDGNDHVILARVAGRLIVNRIKIAVGVAVQIEMSLLVLAREA